VNVSASRFCTYCGAPLPESAGFCPRCGGAVSPAGTATPGPAGAPAAGFALPSPYYPYGQAPAAPPAGPADRSALSRVKLAALLGLVAGALSLVELAATPALRFLSVSTTAGGTSVSVNESAFLLAVLFGSLGVAFTLVELWLYRRAFQTLAPFDYNFSTPASLALAAAIGIVLISLAAAGLVALFVQAFNCAAGGPLTTACLNVGGILGLAVVVLIAAIVALIGYIGVLIGIWRLGVRFNEGMFKIGAVLLLFPVVGVVGSLLIFLGARAALASVGSAPPPTVFR